MVMIRPIAILKNQSYYFIAQKNKNYLKFYSRIFENNFNIKAINDKKKNLTIADFNKANL